MRNTSKLDLFGERGPQIREQLESFKRLDVPQILDIVRVLLNVATFEEPFEFDPRKLQQPAYFVKTQSAGTVNLQWRVLQELAGWDPVAAQTRRVILWLGCAWASFAFCTAMRASALRAKRELVRLEARRKKLVQLVMDGVPGSEVSSGSS